MIYAAETEERTRTTGLGIPVTYRVVGDFTSGRVSPGLASEIAAQTPEASEDLFIFLVESEGVVPQFHSELRNLLYKPAADISTELDDAIRKGDPRRIEDYVIAASQAKWWRLDQSLPGCLNFSELSGKLSIAFNKQADRISQIEPEKAEPIRVKARIVEMLHSRMPPVQPRQIA